MAEDSKTILHDNLTMTQATYRRRTPRISEAQFYR